MKKDKITIVDFDNSGKEKSLQNESDDSMNSPKHLYNQQLGQAEFDDVIYLATQMGMTEKEVRELALNPNFSASVDHIAQNQLPSN